MKNDFIILVADDEHPARKKIISLLKEMQNNFITYEATNGKEAVEQIKKINPDLVLLDIQMPGYDGFKVIENVGVNAMPPVVFTTAFDQYAIDAFEVNAIDYLLKPFDKDRFFKSINRALSFIETKNKSNDNLKLLIDEIKNRKKYLERFMVNAGAKYFFIKAEEIIYISAEEKYIELHTDKGKYLIRETMNNAEESLNPKMFARIHRSFIVNVEQVKEIQSWSHGDYIVILKNGEKLNMSRRYKENLLS